MIDRDIRNASVRCNNCTSMPKVICSEQLHYGFISKQHRCCKSLLSSGKTFSTIWGGGCHSNLLLSGVKGTGYPCIFPGLYGRQGGWITLGVAAASLDLHKGHRLWIEWIRHCCVADYQAHNPCDSGSVLRINTLGLKLARRHDPTLHGLIHPVFGRARKKTAGIRQLKHWATTYCMLWETFLCSFLLTLTWGEEFGLYSSIYSTPMGALQPKALIIQVAGGRGGRCTVWALSMSTEDSRHLPSPPLSAMPTGAGNEGSSSSKMGVTP